MTLEAESSRVWAMLEKRSTVKGDGFYMLVLLGRCV